MLAFMLYAKFVLKRHFFPIEDRIQIRDIPAFHILENRKKRRSKMSHNIDNIDGKSLVFSPTLLFTFFAIKV